MSILLFSVVNHDEERPWRPIQAPEKEERRKRLRGERDKIKLIGLRLEKEPILGFREGRRRQEVLRLIN